MLEIVVCKYQIGAGGYHAGAELLKDCDLAFANKQPVHLDFEGSGGLSSSFLNGFLGDAFDAYGVETIRPLLKAKNISNGQVVLLKKYIEDYRQMHPQA